jgi:ABC-type molybdate transport system substrate-binding protein
MHPSNMPHIPSERADDLHHLEVAHDCDLIIFMAGNQFMVMPELLKAFRSAYPSMQRIFYETLPPGLELQQIFAGGAYFKDEILRIYPDVYTSVNHKSMLQLVETGHIVPDGYQRYLHNRLTLMVSQGNPAGIQKVTDLGRDNVRISQPDPRYEHIAHHILDMYTTAGGRALVDRIMEEKKRLGTTRMTVVHHRETPERLLTGQADVGPVWATEAAHAKRTGLPIEAVEPGEAFDQREHIHYYACVLNRAQHMENARLFVDFLLSPEARHIFNRYGFVTP